MRRRRSVLLCKRQYNCGDPGRSHWHLLCKRQYNCGGTDHSHRQLLCKRQYNCGDTDHSHWHLLCKHQYNCGGTDHSHWHLLCTRQYTCGGTDHSHRQLLCKRQYNCGDTDHSHCHIDTFSANANILAATRGQLDTLSGPLQTHSPLWRALRRTRKRLRTVANTDTTFREHSPAPTPPKETGTVATHSEKTSWP